MNLNGFEKCNRNVYNGQLKTNNKHPEHSGSSQIWWLVIHVLMSTFSHKFKSLTQIWGMWVVDSSLLGPGWCVMKFVPNLQYIIIGSDNGLAQTGAKPLSEPMMA